MATTDTYSGIFTKSKILPQKYTLSNKQKQKKQFQELIQSNLDLEKKFTLAIDLLSTTDNPEKLIKEELLYGLESVGIQTVVLGENPHVNNFKYIEFIDKKHRKQLEKSVDVFIWPSTEREKDIMHYGTLCISHEKSYINPYNAHKEIGDGFFVSIKNHWLLFAEIIRTKESFQFAYDWKHLCQSAMDKSFKA